MLAVSHGGEGELPAWSEAHAAGKKMVGQPDPGVPHIRFEEGAQEMCDRAMRLCPTLLEPLAIIVKLGGRLCGGRLTTRERYS